MTHRVRRWSVRRAIGGLEWRIQRREPATVLYVLVFLLLTFGFVSSGTVELVRDREALPKLSPLALTLAFGGLTAFGQVITTMVVASAFLRDAAWRTDALLFSTPLDRRDWVLGRWGASLAVLVLVSLALPAGAVFGALAPWTAREVPLGTVLLRALRAWALVTLPTVVSVGTLLAIAAVRTRRLLGVLAAALALLFLWQGAESVRRATADGAADVAFASRAAALAPIAAIVDPFGTVAVQQVSAAWRDGDRAARAVPWWGPVATGRLVWLAAALLGGLIVLRRPIAASPRAVSTVRGGPTVAAESSAPTPSAVNGVTGGLTTRLGSIARAGGRHVAWTTLQWTWRETGWRVIGLLGALNVLAHALTASAPSPWDAAGVLLLVREHARLFLILLATIYAGELLWRDHDARVHALVASTPMPTWRLVLGRVSGMAAGQALLVALLVIAAWGGRVLALIGDRGAPRPDQGWWWALPIGAALWLWLPFVQWLLLSLLVHVLVRHKVIAHLLLIAGWVAAVALDANGVSDWWWRFADPPSLNANAPLPLTEAAARGVWWSGLSGAVLALAVRRWPRVTSPR